MNLSVSVLTVVTVDYIPQTLVTLESARQKCNFHSFYVFVADAPADTIKKIRLIVGDDVSWIQFFGPDDLHERREAYMKVFRYFNKFEISNLAKYVGILHLLGDPSAGDICVFVDSDTFFFGDICPVIEEMGENAIFLTPHLLEPSDDDMEHDVMTHGWINAGFLAINRKHDGSKLILEWLITRISRRGHLAPHLGLSCDQTWVSALPVLFRDLVFVSQYKGINVAYWNLNKRPIVRTKENELFAGGVPLLMFHFSGFDEINSKNLSKHTNIRVEAGTVLDEICNSYRNCLMNNKMLINQIQVLSTLPASTSTLPSRIKNCETVHNLKLYKTMVSPGVFTKLGGKLDAVLRKLFNRNRRG